MKPLTFHNVRFVTSAVAASGYPYQRGEGGNPMPEIAIVGRSNVGKSSLINHLMRHKGLARVSATPGKTQLINFFLADEQCFFVDLPGYGFASVPLHVRKEWGPMVQQYLENREGLKLILLLIDIRRGATEEDLQILQWLAHYGINVVLVLTKADKLKSNEQETQIKKVLSSIPYHIPSVVVYSALKDQGRAALLTQINTVLLKQ